MAKKVTRRKTRTKGATRKPAARKARGAAPKKATAKSRARPARKAAAAPPKAKPMEPATGLGSFKTPQPMTGFEPMRPEPWARPSQETHEDLEEEEDEEPL